MCSPLYKGQKKVYFVCKKEGHVSSDCPDKNLPAPEDNPLALPLNRPPVGKGSSSTEPTVISPVVMQEMDISPTQVNVGVTTSVIHADVGKSSEDDNASLPQSHKSWISRMKLIISKPRLIVSKLKLRGN